MRNLAILVCVTFLCQAGCQKPAPLTVEPEPASPAASVSVTLLANPDTNIAVDPVDSTGVLPTDQTNYSGLFLVNSVKYDNGHGVISGASVIAYFGDRNRPLVVNGKIVGYYGIDLMPSAVFPLKLGGIPMVRYPYKIQIGNRDTAFGFMYRAPAYFLATIQPQTRYDWDDPGPDTTRLMPFQDSVVTPEDLTVLAPPGGSILSRLKPVELRWKGDGNISIIVSSYNILTGKTRPILQFQPAVNTGDAVIDASVLQLLPRTKYFVFTFIIANKGNRQLSGMSPTDRILVQAASVYNSYLQIQ